MASLLTGALNLAGKGAAATVDAVEETKDQIQSEEGASEDKKPEVAEVPRRRLQKGDYTIQVHIIECKDLGDQGEDKKQEAPQTFDPVAVVEVMGKKQHSKVPETATRDSIFDEVFVFEFKDVDPDVIETSQCKISICDSKGIFGKKPIGSFSVDLTENYYQPNHEYFRRWMALSCNATGENTGIRGYVMASVVVLGPGDEQHVHDDAEYEIENDEVLMPADIEQNIKHLTLSIWKVEDLPKVDMQFLSTNAKGGCDPYVKVEFAGQSAKTAVHKDTREARIMEKLTLGVREPIMAKKIKVMVYDWDAGSANDLIATTFLDYSLIREADKTGDKSWETPRWYPLYGAPKEKSTGDTAKMNRGTLEGSCYRGRILISACILAEDDVSPSPLISGEPPFPPLQNYTLEMDLYSGNALPATPLRKSFKVECAIGSCRQQFVDELRETR